MPSSDAAGAPTSPDGTSTEDVDPAATAALDAVLGWLADPATVDPARFTDAFLSEVPPDQIAETFTAVGVGAWEAVGVRPSEDRALVARIQGPGPAYLVQLAVTPDGLIEALRFQLAELTDPPASLAALVERLAATDTSVFLRADVTAEGRCAPVTELRSEQTFPIGSAFKLYVLWAITDAISAGELTWDQPVEIRDELDSHPTGITQDELAGASLPVRELAQRMIEISDNTATDHLIELVGRDAVERALVTLGHHDPAATRPLLTTRELFTIKSDPDLTARYAAADEATRRSLLATELAGAPLPPLEQLPTTPVELDRIEWFASPTDLCRALVALDDRAGEPDFAPIREILSTNPGTTVDPARFSQVLHKGGSEPGLLFAAWLATRTDGSRLAVVGGVVDHQAPVDPLTLQLLALGLTLE